MVLTDDILDALYTAAEQKCKEIGVPVCFAVSDRHGYQKLFRRFGRTPILSIILAEDMAYTAALTQMQTKDLIQGASREGVLPHVQDLDHKITMIPGGYPLVDADGKVIGGIGVSGGTDEQDCAIAEFVLSAYAELTA
ncbi:MAG: heme-binding protein [Eggerthellaceae bacterium]|nr:heme-binding protein [Eggerthellaceae bacterium]